MLKADLHIHSKHSPDGELEVREVLNACKSAGLGIISITDHNLVKGIPEARKFGSKYGIKVIPGIEIDCNYKGIDLHVLGYNINWESRDFAALEDQIAGKVMGSFLVMIDNLSKAGIEVDADEVLLKAGGQLPCAELIAEVLLSNANYNDNEKLRPYRKGGGRSDMPYINFYLDYFAQGKPAYVKIDYMSYHEAIALIKRNNGVPVVAHPGLNLRGREETILELLDNGAEGLEAFNNYHDYEQITYFAGITQRRSVLMTCGSDFHGKNKPLIRPGAYRTVNQFEDYATASVGKLL
jgi:predicted metal-dependent phosphoesterase TrpH